MHFKCWFDYIIFWTPFSSSPLLSSTHSYSRVFAVKVEVPSLHPLPPGDGGWEKGLCGSLLTHPPSWSVAMATASLAWNEPGGGVSGGAYRESRGSVKERKWNGEKGMVTWGKGKKEETWGEGDVCFGGVNILELVPVIQKVTSSDCKHTCVSVGFKKSFRSSMCMHVYASVCFIVCYFLYGIFTTMAVVDRVFICGSCRVQSIFSILLL